MIYLIIAIICSVISGYLFKKASGTISLHSPNMMSLVFYFYFILNNVIGAVLVVNNLDDHDIVNKLSNDVCRIYGYWAIMYTIVFFPIGQLVANRMFGISNMSRVYNRYINEPLSDERKNNAKRIKNILVVVSFLSVVSVLYTMYFIGGSPLKYLWGDADVMDMTISRIESSRNFGGNEYIKNIFGILLTPLLSYVAYGYKRCSRSKFNQCWFWIMFVSSILILTYNLEKSPILWYLLGFVFYRVYLGKKLSNKILIIMFAIIMLILVGMYVILSSYTSDALFVFNQGIVGRLILTSCAGLFIAFDVFPNQHAFLGFSSFSSLLSSAFGMAASDRSARIVMEVVNPAGVNAGLAGVYNGLFVSEAWANWGLIGVLLSPIYVGFIIQCFYIFYLRHKKTPLLMGLMIYYTIQSGINGGVNDYIYNVTVAFLIILVAFIYSSNGTIRIQKIR